MVNVVRDVCWKRLWVGGFGGYGRNLGYTKVPPLLMLVLREPTIATIAKIKWVLYEERQYALLRVLFFCLK